MAKYLIIKNMEVLKANANPVWYIVAPPALTAYHGFIQALLLNLINKEEYVNDSEELVLHDGFSIIHRDIQMIGTMKNTKYGQTYFPNQISSASAYDKDDYVKNTTQIASQPTATCNLFLDLIIRLPKSIVSYDTQKIKNFLYKANIAGGKINNANKNMEVLLTENYEKLLNLVKSGFYITDRHDLLKKRDMSDTDSSLDKMLQKTRLLKNKEQRNKEESWLIPSSVGYLCLTPFESRDNSRNGNEVAYAEPVVTLTQYVPVKNVHNIPFWNWTTQEINGKNLFILKGEKNDSN
jgi:CRISPR type I-F-associated protein Csy2